MDLEKPETISALRLLSCLSQETKLAIYRELHSLCEESFTGKLMGKVVTDEETDRLKLLESLMKEQERERREQAKREEPVRRWD